MDISKTPHEWSKDALFSKAQRYANMMLENTPSDWQFGFWSSLTLEMLTRSVLANISPSLVANGKDWNNLLHAVGIAPNQQRFTPKSADISELLKMAESIFPKFTREMLNFSIAHINKRNSEVHSGAMPFDGIGSSSWLPAYFSACNALIENLDESLESLFGTEAAKDACAHISALEDKNAKSVKGTINAHRTIWNEKEKSEQDSLSQQALVLSTRYQGHRVSCPSCNNIALVKGSAIGAPKSKVEENYIIEKQNMLPDSFECTACGLKVIGYSKLMACGLGDSYVSTNQYDAVDYFEIDIEEEFQSLMYEDNNEP